MHKVGVIGYGYMAGWHHSNSNRIEGLQFTSAYDIDPERLKAAEAKGLKAYASREEFLAKGDFDIVLVATPNNVHMEPAIAAMNAGKHVVSEKPVAMSSAELEAMTEASVKNGVLFTVHQNRRWDKDFLIVRKTIKDGLIGKPYTIESRVHGSRGAMFGWRADKEAGGGMMLDWGVHLIDQIMFMIPEKVKDVYCRMFKVKTPDVDDYFKMVITFESGLCAQIEVGTYCLKPLPRWYANGDSGSVYIESWDCQGKILQAKVKDEKWSHDVVAKTAAGPTRTMAPRTKEEIKEVPLPEIETDWADYYTNILAVLDGRAPELLVKPAEAMRVMKVMEACFKSSETGGTITLGI
ncbi:MAG: Gfo/Idh/MocA family oxidoreductase [Eubacteriales bacterium]|nr:Gfo/Idh/MocA family oxidoreductase [Eubacteriales bacterium]